MTILKETYASVLKKGLAKTENQVDDRESTKTPEKEAENEGDEKKRSGVNIFYFTHADIKMNNHLCSWQDQPTKWKEN